MQKNDTEIYGVIYKITNNLDGKVYIGQTRKGFDIRYHNNIQKYTHNRHLKSAIKKYGISKFTVEKCIDIAYSKNELEEKERFYIDKYQSKVYGYNLTLGGEGVAGLSPELHGMYGVHRYGKNNPFYGKKHTSVTRKKLSIHASKRVGGLNPNYNNGDKIKGTNNPMYRVSPKERMTKEVYERWLQGIKQTVSGSGNPNASKVINVTTGEEFECIKDAIKIYGEIAISACCRGKCKTAGKCKWMYYNDYLNNEITRTEVIE